MKQLHRWKLYFDKDLEESWLNQLAQQGWGMSSFCLGRYTFEPIEPGEYIYRVDLLPSDEEKTINPQNFIIHHPHSSEFYSFTEPAANPDITCFCINI